MDSNNTNGPKESELCPENKLRVAYAKVKKHNTSVEKVYEIQNYSKEKKECFLCKFRN